MYDKIHFLLLVSSIAFYFLSPDTDVPILTENVQASEVYSTGKTTWEKVESGVLSEVSVRGKEDKIKLKNEIIWWKMEMSEWPIDEGLQMGCDKICKIQTLKDIGIRPEIAESLVNNCKALADDPVNCIRIGSFIVVNESSGGNRCKKSNSYNCFGMSVNVGYKRFNDGVIHWIGKYNRYWFNQKTPDSFYPDYPWEKTRTGYCTSEKQPNWVELNYCPNWHKHAWTIFNKLESW